MKVNWNEKACCHSGKCVGTLPEVFAIENQTLVIRPEKASKEQVMAVVSACPGKAFSVEDD